MTTTNVICYVIIGVFFLLSAIQTFFSIRKSRAEIRENKRNGEVLKLVNALISLYFMDQFTHLMSPSVWVQAKNIDNVDVKSAFLLKMAEVKPLIYCNVDWDGPNKVLINRLADDTIFLDRSNGRKPTEEDYLIVTEKEFWTMSPTNFSVK